MSETLVCFDLRISANNHKVSHASACAPLPGKEDTVVSYSDPPPSLLLLLTRFLMDIVSSTIPGNSTRVNLAFTAVGVGSAYAGQHILPSLMQIGDLMFHLLLGTVIE